MHSFGHGISAQAGIGLRHAHFRDMLERLPPLAFLEVHSENFFGAGGPPHFFLEQLRENYPLSLHGVGLSLGSIDPLNTQHLNKLKRLIDRYQPDLVSEHLCWGSSGGIFSNDLLPMPYSEEAIRHMAQRIDAVQNALGRRILVENLSQYVAFPESEMSEWQFVAEVVEAADCQLLLDINNIYVNACNFQFNAKEYLRHMPAERVVEYHLAGYERGERCLIDTHGHPVSDEVWALFSEALSIIGPRPSLIEWDTDIPPLSTLLGEARKADQLLERHRAAA